MRILVFAGPSLGQTPPPVHEELTFFPPAGQCDVMSAVHRLCPDAVVIADTRVWPSMSVLHKELIWALSKGVRIIGTAAGGALRAAELSFCGMKGHGRVFDRTTQGLLEDDAEVFCAWEQTKTGYRRTTEPLVNIRATLASPAFLKEAGDADTDRFLTAAAALYYKKRTRAAMEKGLIQTGFSPERAAALMDSFGRHYLDIQAQDLAQTLEKLFDPGFLPEPLTPEQMPVPIDDQGAIFRMLYDHDRIVEQDGHQMRLFEIGNFVTTRHPDMERLAYNAFNRELTLVLADQTGLEVLPEEIENTTERFRRTSGLEEDSALSDWLARNDLSLDDFKTLMRDETRVRKLQDAFLAGQMFQKNTRPVLDFLRLTHAYPEWRERAFEREKTIAGQKDSLREDFLSEDFLAMLMEKHETDPLPWKDKIRPAADAVGIGAKDLKMELLKDRLRDRVVLEHLEKTLF